MKTLGQNIASRDNNFDTVRLFLAGSVIFYHSFGLAGVSNLTDPVDLFLLSHGASLGELAVGCFFFLSGLFVTQSFHRDGSPIHFIIRRFCRIWPGLFVCAGTTALIACFLSQGLNAISYISSPDLYQYIARNSMLMPIWYIPGVFEGRANAAINGAIHTIPPEVKIYGLLLCLNAVFPVTRKRNVAIGGAAFLLLTFFLFEPIRARLGMPPYSRPYFVMFFAGVIAYACADWIKPYPWLGSIGAILAMALPSPWNTICLYFSICWAAIFVGQLQRFWRPRWDVSYGVYIYGWPCQQFITTLFPHINPYPHAVASFLLALGFGGLSWRLIERPSIQLGHWLTDDGVTQRAAWRDWATLSRLALLTTLLGLFGLSVEFPSVSRSFDHRKAATMDLQIVDFGPKETGKGVAFNVQPDGTSAIWLVLDRDAPKDARIVFGGQTLDTARGTHLLTATVPKSLYEEPGEKSLYIEVWSAEETQRSAPVTFRITS